MTNVPVWVWPSLALQFLLELAVLAALAYWGYSTSDSGWLRIAVAVVAPLVAAAVWGLFGAPRAPRHLTGVRRLALQVVFFGSAVLALAASGHGALAIAFAAVCAANTALLIALGLDDAAPAGA